MLTVYKERISPDQVRDVIGAFEEGVVAHAGEDIASVEEARLVEMVPAMRAPVLALTAGDESPAAVAAAVEFVLEGLHLSKRLNKDSSGTSATYRDRAAHRHGTSIDATYQRSWASLYLGLTSARKFHWTNETEYIHDDQAVIDTGENASFTVVTTVVAVAAMGAAVAADGRDGGTHCRYCNHGGYYGKLAFFDPLDNSLIFMAVLLSFVRGIPAPHSTPR